MSRFDARPTWERGRKALAPQGREQRFDVHATDKAVLCGCITRYPVECLCCQRVLCFTCAGLINLNVDVSPDTFPHLFNSNDELPKDYEKPFEDPLGF